jgi:hypothetical protein
MESTLWLNHAQLANEYALESWLEDVRLLLASRRNPGVALLIDLREGDSAPGSRAALDALWGWLLPRGLRACIVVANTDAWIAFTAVSSPRSLSTLILDIRVTEGWQEVALGWMKTEEAHHHAVAEARGTEAPSVHLPRVYACIHCGRMRSRESNWARPQGCLERTDREVLMVSCFRCSWLAFPSSRVWDLKPDVLETGTRRQRHSNDRGLRISAHLLPSDLSSG